jgi:alkanesulfonate monooxygenase
VYAFWGEPLESAAARKQVIDKAAAAHGRTMRYSISFRPIIADTEKEAWEKADWVAETATARIALAKERIAGAQGAYKGLGGESTRTLSTDRKANATTSVGRMRLIEMSERGDVLDERLWMKVANLTGAAGNSTALVGTPEQVAEAMLRYYDLGITAFVLKGFDPLNDAVDYGKRLLPLLREGAAQRAPTVGR